MPSTSTHETHLFLCTNALLYGVDLFADLIYFVIHWVSKDALSIKTDNDTCHDILLTHSAYILTTSSTTSTASGFEPNRFLCDSLIASAFPPFASMNSSTSRVMVVGQGFAEETLMLPGGLYAL